MKFCYNESKNNDNLKIPGRKAFFMLMVAAFMAGKDNAVEQQIAQGIYYLKKCIMVLRGAEQLPSLAPLCERLIKEGISCQVMLSEELSPDVLQAGEMLAPGLLYLTDDPLIYAMLAAEEERSQGNALPCCPPALVYLHPGNRDEDFGDARYALEEPEETEPEYLERVYRRCHNLPWEILVTDRCWLRETVEEDVDSFWKMYQDSELSRYTERLYPTPEAERGYVREYRRLVYSFYEFGVWTVLDRQSGAVVGRAGLSVREGYDLPELGFVIGREWQGRGLAGEVCQGILEYARELLGFERVQALVHEENTVSLHLCQKLGFRQQAVPGTVCEPCEEQSDQSRTTCFCYQEEKEQGEGFGGRAMEKIAAVYPSCLVEMEQNGQMARFAYMIYESDTQAAE